MLLFDKSYCISGKISLFNFAVANYRFALEIIPRAMYRVLRIFPFIDYCRELLHCIFITFINIFYFSLSESFFFGVCINKTHFRKKYILI